MDEPEPTVQRQDPSPFISVRGTFYRAVDPSFRRGALDGSHSAGRFSPRKTPTLYLSASRAGVAVAMLAHTHSASPDREVLSFEVAASYIADLRDAATMASIGVDVDAAAAPWQDDVAAGRTPASWRVRERLLELGAQGLIDPSRQRPGLWHLTLFTWNRPDAPCVLPR
ncbi:RES family NAD+ phosphorylase [Nesterenkonia sp. E16_10]|uniref:RES family NAD+ phosphorylase n=1 Tax=unclassified Nesterenkonia TaxID=2629769 RepID=UPI0031F60CFB